MKDIKINPTKILVKDIEDVQEKTSGGIFIPTTVKAPTMKGKIIKVGDGTPDMKINHQANDIALFHPSAGVKLTWENVEYRLIDVSDVFLSGV
jgi:co-chaperonin GroES (HSP10)